MPDKYDDPREELEAVIDQLASLAIKEHGQQAQIDALRGRVAMISEMIVRERDERDEREGREPRYARSAADLEAIELEAQYLRGELNSLRTPAEHPEYLSKASQDDSKRGIHMLALAIRQAPQTRKER